MDITSLPAKTVSDTAVDTVAVRNRATGHELVGDCHLGLPLVGAPTRLGHPDHHRKCAKADHGWTRPCVALWD